MRRIGLFLLAMMLVAGCADILGLDPLGPAVRDGDDDQADAAADASDQ